VLSATAFSAATTTRITVTFTFNDSTPRLLMFAGIGSLQLKVRAPLALNDYPSTATTITGTRGTINGDNLKATTSSDEPGASGVIFKNTVWYKWTPTFSGPAAADTNFSYIRGLPELQPDSGNTVHNTVIAVYQETSPGTLVPVTADDDDGWQANSLVMFTAAAGSTYYFQIGSSAASSSAVAGRFRFNYYQANTAGEIYYPFGESGTLNGAHNLGWAQESEGSLLSIIGRRYAGTLTASCQLATIPANSSATAGTDYQSITTSIAFTNPISGSDTAWAVPFSLNLIDNSVSEGTEEVGVGLSNASANATISSVFGRFYIADDDSPESTNFTLLTPVVRIAENADYAVIRLQRNGSGGGFFYLTCELQSTTASADEFVLPESQSAYPGATTVQFVSIIRDDQVFEADESIYLKIPTSYYGYESVEIIIEDDDPFIPMTGRLSALLSYANGARPAPLYATVSTSGTITGKLTLQGKAVPFVTKVNERGKATALIPIAGRPSLSLKIEAKDATGGFHFSLVDGLTNSVSEADAVLQNYVAKVNPCPEVGRYTFSSSAAGWATGTVSVTGTATLAGRLFDGAPFTMTGYVDGDGKLSAAAALYAGLGSVRVSGDLPLLASQGVGCIIQCYRPARAGDPAKLGANYYSANSTACRYTPAANVRTSLDAWSAGTGKATLTGGPLMNTLTKALTVNLTSIATPVDAEKLKISVVPSTGVFSGSFVLPGSTKVLPFYGVLTQFTGMNGSGKGFFFDGLKTGTITIGKP
ncbi:MAG: hypothetical protein NTV80_19235, partial [Verrucomicrobia bacterium]|nr:hypothetical protein [Verrucomicrobiota bacterium]